MKKILFVDGCVSRATSRTERLVRACLARRYSAAEFVLETVVLEDSGLTALNAEGLAARERKIQAGKFADDAFKFARAFADASEVVIAVPYWDLSFPALLKIYLEQLCIRNLTFRYAEDGRPVGLTKVKKVTYVTTSGGYIGNCNFGFAYVKGLMQNLFGIADVAFISAEGLDILGNDPETILRCAIAAL